ncbi:kynurenine aminotransferase-like [Phymastichus coffea]|uniref:kynurenine aminotransferase-like n=1 Tax=Phymastichus coffea TaxID=108790 RepID=UPI00273C2227|nr:kynurenine aminotransferase-like [Phymastichus coffea]
MVNEVYEFFTFDNNEHIRIATLPGIFEQAITISSVKTMIATTGFKIGWAYGSKKLIYSIKEIQSQIPRNPSRFLQESVAVILEQETKNFGKPYSIIERLKKHAQANRDYLYRSLIKVGMTPILPQGGYNMIANWTTMRDRILLESKNDECTDLRFSNWFIKNINILSLPLSHFYHDEYECSRKDFISMTIIKGSDTYKKAEKLLSEWLSRQ